VYRRFGHYLAVRSTLVGLAFGLTLGGSLALAQSVTVAEQPTPVPRPKVNRFDGMSAWYFLGRQVRLGPRPAGSRASRQLADILRRSVPRGRFQPVPGGLRNVIGVVPGRNPRRVIVVGAHYDTKDIPGFVGANDGASGTAVVRQLARTIKPRQLRPTIVFIFFDGEESPGPSDDQDFLANGVRGSKVASRTYRNAESMILLDFVGDRELEIPREQSSTPALWLQLRNAAKRVGAGSVFPAREQGPVLDDHVPFLSQGVPAIDLIDFDFPCWHKTCDNISAVSMRSLDAVGEAVLELLRRL
jgi:glutaminyl-peptide cyclotransferase